MSIGSFLKRKKYGVARRVLPKVRTQHKLDSMVGPIGYWDSLQKYQLNVLKHFGLKPHHALLDVGCGPLQGGIAFIKYLNPNGYVGIDLRDQAIEEGYRQVVRFGLAGKNPFLAVADDFGESFLSGKFDYIWTSQLLYHLEENQVDDLFQVASKVLNRSGVFLCDIIGHPNRVMQDSQWSGFRFYLHSESFIITTAKKHSLKAEPQGMIEHHGYPPEIPLKTNILFKIVHE